MGYKQDFIDFMVRSGVLTFGEFVTKSGRRTPYFINTGLYKTGAQIAGLGGFYARCIMENAAGEFDLIYGPSYKGIPLAVAAAVSLYREHGVDARYCFNRKEVKDHGEGGSLIGYTPRNGDRVLIVEDVITAGTSVRESLALLRGIADVEVTNLVVSVDRMEKGMGGDKTTLQELRDEFGIKATAIVTIREILAHLRGREIDGRLVLDRADEERIEEYLRVYGG